MIRAGSTPADSAIASSPRRAHVDRQPLAGHPVRDRADHQGLARVGDLGLGERVAVGAATVPHVGLVEDVGGCAELVGDVVERDSADPDPAPVVDGRWWSATAPDPVAASSSCEGTERDRAGSPASPEGARIQVERGHLQDYAGRVPIGRSLTGT